MLGHPSAIFTQYSLQMYICVIEIMNILGRILLWGDIQSNVMKELKILFEKDFQACYRFWNIHVYIYRISTCNVINSLKVNDWIFINFKIHINTHMHTHRCTYEGGHKSNRTLNLVCKLEVIVRCTATCCGSTQYSSSLPRGINLGWLLLLLWLFF